ncbi:hypothetical protein [Nocardioides sp.]|uniref:hypothetical protein n=1 Tax=Nocardioides sp. TaxID=35761 RepID=UPI002C5DC941|nr:hypothetical protein [Nocardioides sp.]HSX66591.1 hypothetical protein [Nocardioides sp.]
MKLRATYANVAATAALVISMSGTAYAATVIYSSNIADGTIRSVDVRDDSLQSRDILNGTITRADINDTTEAALKGQTGDAGPQGPQGETGPQGEVGPEGPQGPQGEVGPAGADGAAGPAGPSGPAGPTGPQGASGTNGVSGWEVIRQPYSGPASDANKQVIMYCPTGKKPLSGGYDMATGSRVVTVDQNHYYNFEGQGWVVSARLTNLNGNVTADYSFAGWLICATVQ